jgi:primary-amine oxidase
MAERERHGNALSRRSFVALSGAAAAISELGSRAAAHAAVAPAAPRAAAHGAVPSVAAHPLDPLAPPEFERIKKILARETWLGPRTIFPWVQLNEPPKAEVLAWAPGRAFRREALVVALAPNERTAYEAIVDLRSERVLSSRNLHDLQPFLTTNELERAAGVVDASPEVKTALEKRGYRIPGKISDRFFIDTYAPGKDPATVRDGKTIRAVRALLADKQGGINDYGPYVEGLMVLVDVYGESILAITDRPGAIATRRVPEDIFDRSVLGPERPVADLTIRPQTRSRMHFDGNRVRWEGWDFRYSFNQREGLVMHQIGFNDGGRVRSICYRAAVSEMLVPYSDASPEWVWREFFDAGEYGLGSVAVNLRPGKELPDNAFVLDAVLPGESLETLVEPNRVFFYERENGALFAHVQASDRRHIYARAKELVAGYVTNVGNYDYLFTWVFRQDGSFGFQAELQGLVLNKTIFATACGVCEREAQGGPGTYRSTGQEEFGTLVSPQMLAVTHQHWINLRMDFDVDGTANAVEEYNVERLPEHPQTNPAGRALVVKRTVFGKAHEACRMLDEASNRTWVVYNPSKRSEIGQFAGYEIEPVTNTFSSIPEDRYGEATSFVQRHLWVTPYDPNELYAAGWYPNQHPADYTDGLAAYADDRSIYNRDVVVWYSLGFTHVTRPEDFPIMPSERVGVNFKPRGFFAKSPALGYARLDQEPDTT